MVAAVVLAAALTGCSDSGTRGQPELSRTQVESGITEQLADQVGTDPRSVSCPDDLAGKVDTELRCTLTRDDGTELGVTVTVTAVRGDTIDYRIDVEDQPVG